MSGHHHSQGLTIPPDTETLIRDSWQRCYENYRLEPDRVPEPDVLTQAELGVVRAPTEELAALAQGELDRMMRQLGDHVHLLMLANPDGTLMDLRVDPQFEADCRQALIMPGARFTEQSQGTNGIGLCLQTLSPVSVVMHEHFAHRLSGLSCTVAPIFGQRGELAAVLNVTSLRPSSRTVHQIAKSIVENSAKRIENRSFDVRCAGKVVLRLSASADFCDPAGEARLALDDQARIVDATPAALQMLDATADLYGQRMQGVNNLDTLLQVLDSTHPAIHLPTGAFNIQRASTSVPNVLKDLAKRNFRTGFSSHQEISKTHRTQKNIRHFPRSTRQSDDVEKIEEIAGADEASAKDLRIARRLYERGLPILLQGETGTGKTLLAKALHEAGPNRFGNFVSINCAAIPSDLIESELFGYRAGAFTGASRNGSRGRIIQADGGTLFLDEIGDMPLALQSSLLQVLSEKEFVPIGATEPVRADFCLIAASHRNIEEMVQKHTFREDLYFRIRGAQIHLKPLRLRNDLAQLIQKVLKQSAQSEAMPQARLSDAAERTLLAYDWPGNIRELKHVLRYALALSDGPLISTACLPQGVCEPSTRVSDPHRLDPKTTDRQTVSNALEKFNWNVAGAARWLGVSRSTLHRRIRLFRLDRQRS